MAILNIQSIQVGLVGVKPGLWSILTNDTAGTIVTAGYLNQAFQQGFSFNNGDLAAVITTPTPSSTAYSAGWYQIQSGGNGVWSITSSASSQASNTVTSSATPGTVRAFTGLLTNSATVMTSGNIVGVRGAVNMVGASGGFAYGVQGKVVPTGTLSGSSWTAPVFAQFDISSATINAGQTAPVWADYGASAGTLTSVTGMRMFAGTNTIASLTLHAMDYRYGKASNLFELDGNAGTYITSGGAGTLSGTIEKIAIVIDGVQYYIPCATVIS